jgi:hypothetical protein
MQLAEAMTIRLAAADKVHADSNDKQHEQDKCSKGSGPSRGAGKQRHRDDELQDRQQCAEQRRAPTGQPEFGKGRPRTG